METASWEYGIFPVCDRCSCGQIQDEAHILFMCSSNLVSRLPASTVYLISFCNAIRSFFYFMSEILNLRLAGMDQPQADQPNSLAGGLPV
eukprot:1160998-Pelagomonas_calceolata.AAC.4